MGRLPLTNAAPTISTGVMVGACDWLRSGVTLALESRALGLRPEYGVRIVQQLHSPV